MDYENRYKGALEAIKKLQEANPSDEGIQNWVNDNFPELKESEDEKIRNSIIENLKGNMYRADGDYDLLNKQIAWLEKQESVEEIVARCKDSWYKEGKIAGMAEGLTDDEKYQQGWHDAIEKQEEKVDNANMIEPKFHEGEWIVWQDKCCKVNYNGCGYELVDQNGLSTSLEYGTVDENAHIWDITKDAEDGDVLVSDNIIFIFNKIHDVWINCHCSTHKDGSFMEEDYDLMTIKYSKEVYPATKEQRDKLLKAMADAGWQFDFEKKKLNELKKVEPNSAWSNGYSNDYIQAVEKAVQWLENHNDYIDVKDGNVTYFDMEKCVEDFRKAMKGGENDKH